MKLKTKRLVLRNLKKRDAKDLVKHLNNLNISKWLLAVPFPYTIKDSKWWINNCKKKAKEKPIKSYEFGIELKSKKEIIGGVGLLNIKQQQRTAELGYWLSQDYWKKGIMKEAVKKVINFAFNKFKLRRLTIPIYSENKASRALAKSLGFKLEGKLRKNCICLVDIPGITI